MNSSMSCIRRRSTIDLRVADDQLCVRWNWWFDLERRLSLRKNSTNYTSHTQLTKVVLLSIYFRCRGRKSQLGVIALLCSPRWFTLRGTAAAARRWSEHGKVLEIRLGLRCSLLNVLSWNLLQALSALSRRRRR